MADLTPEMQAAYDSYLKNRIRALWAVISVFAVGLSYIVKIALDENEARVLSEVREARQEERIKELATKLSVHEAGRHQSTTDDIAKMRAALADHILRELVDEISSQLKSRREARQFRARMSAEMAKLQP